jgi:hypothetical protein
VAPHTVSSLRFSPDGRQLAVGLHGQGGLAVLDLASAEVVARDSEYRGKLMTMAFDPQGRLATVALDGFVRYYRHDYALLARRATQAALAPVTMAFNAGADLLAVGFIDRAAVEILRASDLQPVRTLVLPAGEALNAVAVEWVDDGRSLVVAGDAHRAGAQPAWRFRTGRWRSPQRLRLPAQRLNALLDLGQGRTLFISEDPGIGWFDRAGRTRWLSRPALLDFSGTAGALRVSPDARAVALPLGRGGPRAVFRLDGVGLLQGQAARQAESRWSQTRRPAPRPAARAGSKGGQRVAVRLSRAGASVGGVAVPLDTGDEARTHAIAPDGRSVYLGTEWTLRAIEPNGQARWTLALSANVRALGASGDGHHVVALLGDGTVRWYDSAGGQERLALFVHAGRRDWIAWTPSGHYASSPQGDQLVGWHLNQGPEAAPDFIRAVQLERLLYRPDRVSAALPRPGTGTAGHAAAASRPASTAAAPGRLDSAGPAGPAAALGLVPPARALQRDQLQRVAPPRVQVQVRSLDEARARAEIEVQIERPGAEAPVIRDVAVYVNEVPVVAGRDRGVGLFERASLSRTFEVPLDRAWNDIRVEAFTEASIGLAQTGVALARPPVAAPRGALYLLAVGVSQFDTLGRAAALGYAARDAEALAQAWSGEGGDDAFTARHVRVLSDGAGPRPTRGHIVEALDFLAEARAEDTVIVFLASHGVTDAAGNYYFVPADARAQDLHDGQAVGDAASLLGWEVFFDALRRTAGRRVLVVDTCSARGIAGTLAPTALIKRSASSHFALMLASGEAEASQEYAAGGHGLFTYGLLEALGAARAARQGGPATAAFTLQAWFDAALPLVRRHHDPRVGPQTPQLVLPAALGNWALLEAPLRP